jgi:hypothetical protein
MAPTADHPIPNNSRKRGRPKKATRVECKKNDALVKGEQEEHEYNDEQLRALVLMELLKTIPEDDERRDLSVVAIQSKYFKIFEDLLNKDLKNDKRMPLVIRETQELCMRVVFHIIQRRSITDLAQKNADLAQKNLAEFLVVQDQKQTIATLKKRNEDLIDIVVSLMRYL